jgi:hypothetical protein
MKCLVPETAAPLFGERFWLALSPPRDTRPVFIAHVRGSDGVHVHAHGT